MPRRWCRLRPSSRRQAILCMPQNGFGLIASHAREPCQEIIESGAVFQILEECLHRNACPLKNPSAAHFPRNSLDRRTLIPIKHDLSLQPASVAGKHSGLRTEQRRMRWPALGAACAFVATIVHGDRFRRVWRILMHLYGPCNLFNVCNDLAFKSPAALSTAASFGCRPEKAPGGFNGQAIAFESYLDVGNFTIVSRSNAPSNFGIESA